MKVRKINIPRVNVIPILDALFILIFFLLTNSKMADFFQLSVAKPVIKNLQSSNVDKLKGKFFKVRMTSTTLQITEGVQEKVLNSYPWTTDGLMQLSARLEKLKQKFPEEISLVLKSEKNLPYKQIIKVIDMAQRKIKYTKDAKEFIGPIFAQVAFEGIK